MIVRNCKKEEKAITLVALVVTIVILLILSGVSINLVVGNNGVITRAQEAKQATLNDSIASVQTLDSLAHEIDSEMGILPEEYKKVEYIESSGTQYIMTNIKNNSENVFNIKIYSNVANKDMPVFGSREESYKLQQIYWYNTLAEKSSILYDSLTSLPYIFPLSIVATFSKEKSVINGAEILNTTSVATFSGTKNLALFGVNTNDTIDERKFIGKIYYFSVENNNILVCNMLPCYRKSDNVAGMYDLVNGKFYTNSGTGNFTVGPEVQ